jgi:hypothetical protein
MLKGLALGRSGAALELRLTQRKINLVRYCIWFMGALWMQFLCFWNSRDFVPRIFSSVSRHGQFQADRATGR